MQESRSIRTRFERHAMSVCFLGALGCVLLAQIGAGRTTKTSPAQAATGAAAVASGTSQTFTLNPPAQRCRVWVAAGCPSTIRVKYNAAAASITSWDAELAPGDVDIAPPPPDVLIATVSIYADSAEVTIGTHVSIQGW